MFIFIYLFLGDRLLSKLHTQCGNWGGAWSHDPEILTWGKIKSWMINKLSHPSTPFLTFWGTSIPSSIVPVPACILTNSACGFLYLHISPTFVSCVFLFSHSDRCEVISHCSFDLHFPNDEWWWTSFYMSLRHLYVFCSFLIELFILGCWAL